MNYYFYVLRHYADFNGRAKRREFWYFILFNTIIFALLTFLIFLSIIIENEIMILLFVVLYALYRLVIIIPSIAVFVRRMHDVGKSGWFILVPIYNLILCLTKGNEGKNRFDTKNSTGDFLSVGNNFSRRKFNFSEKSEKIE